jgi:hypothetical protein
MSTSSVRDRNPPYLFKPSQRYKARFRVSISAEVRRSIACLNFSFRTVVILSTMIWDETPARSLPWVANSTEREVRQPGGNDGAKRNSCMCGIKDIGLHDSQGLP